MQRFLVAFAALDGQTDKIAHHIARKLEDARFLVRLIDMSAGETEAGADSCDAVILAASAYRQHFDSGLSAFILRHGEVLRRCPSAFVPVSLAAASHDPAEKSAIDEVARQFLSQVGWAPDEVFHVAGAIGERSSSLLNGTVLEALFEPVTDEPESPRELELTDWDALDKFVRGFGAHVAATTPPSPADESGRT